MRFVQYHPRALVGDGGVSNSVRSLSAALVREGADAAIAYDGRDGPPPREDPVTWIPVEHRGRPPFRVPTELSGAIADADLLVLNSAWTAHNARAGRVARTQGVPYVVAHRGAYDPRILVRRRWAKRAWWMAFERRLVDGAAAAHVFFPSQADDLRSLGYRGPVIVAPNGIDVPDDVRWDGGSGGYVLYIGRFDPEHKGLDLLCEAIAALPPHERPMVRLHGPDWKGGKRRVVQQVERSGLTGTIVVGPPVYGEEKWSLLAAAAGFVYPSRWEGFGNAPAEAAAMGVPTVVTPYPLGRHLARNGAALLADPAPESLAGALRSLFEDDLRDVGRRAADLVADEFTWRAVARTWLDQVAGVR
jgi:glycosyltransferase involved in cell wall biosynthesis